MTPTMNAFMQRGGEPRIAVGRKLPAGDGLLEQRDHLAPATFVGRALAQRDGRHSPP